MCPEMDAPINVFVQGHTSASERDVNSDASFFYKLNFWRQNENRNKFVTIDSFKRHCLLPNWMVQLA